MRNSNSVHISAAVLIMVAMVVVYSCGSSSPNMNGNTASSSSAKFVTCPAIPAALVSITTSPAFAPPSTPTIAVNDIVKWTNNDSMIHTVTSGTGAPPAFDGKFDSGQIAPNGTVCVQFLVAGAYPYFCNIHPFMIGTVTVQ